MIDKTVASVEDAVAGIEDGSTIMIGGFGRAGQPVELIDALIAHGASDLTIVNNNAGNGDTGLAALLAAKRVRRIICSFPRQSDSWVFDGLYRAGEIELELVPQGNLPSGSARRGQASARSSRPQAWARSSPRARRSARSTAAATCSSIRFEPTTR